MDLAASGELECQIAVRSSGTGAFKDEFSVHHRGIDLRGAQFKRVHLKDILREHHKIGVKTGLETSFDAFFKFGVRRFSRVGINGVIDVDALFRMPAAFGLTVKTAPRQ